MHRGKAFPVSFSSSSLIVTRVMHHHEEGLLGASMRRSVEEWRRALTEVEIDANRFFFACRFSRVGFAINSKFPPYLPSTSDAHRYTLEPLSNSQSKMKYTPPFQTRV
jgi:hypothetical protein